MSKPLNPEILKQWKETYRAVDALEDQIQDRIDDILEAWFAAFDGTLSTWWFEGAREGQVGNMPDHINADTIYSLHVEMGKPVKCNDSYDMVIIDKDGNEYAFQDEIPTRWLFEDFEQEIVEGKKLFDEQQAKKKQQAQDKRSKKKEKDTELVKAAKAKLSKEELAAIKRTL